MHSNFNHERWVMCCSAARSQRSVVEECLKCALFCSLPHSSDSATQVDFPAQSIRQASDLTACHSSQTCSNDITRGERAELAGEYHVSNVPHGVFIQRVLYSPGSTLVYPRNSHTRNKQANSLGKLGSSHSDDTMLM
jgi:hypothetical protein